MAPNKKASARLENTDELKQMRGGQGTQPSGRLPDIASLVGLGHNIALWIEDLPRHSDKRESGKDCGGFRADQRTVSLQEETAHCQRGRANLGGLGCIEEIEH